VKYKSVVKVLETGRLKLLQDKWIIPPDYDLKAATKDTRADNYTAIQRMACNKSSWKAANQSQY
jgi:hypothetical protein